MHLISATVRNYRVHRERMIEFDRSRSLIGGPNESGKSTLIEAIHRALFLRSKTGGAVQRQMISTLHPGQPEVEVLFSAGNKRYRLLKRFSGASGTTNLTEIGGGTWHGDDAEARLTSLLQVEDVGGGRGAENRIAQQWAHLWVWQGKSGDDPCLHAGSEHAALLQRLQQTGGAAAMQSQCDSDVASDFAKAVNDIFGLSGRKPKKGSDLEKAESAVEVAEIAWRQAVERVGRLHQAVTDFEDASTTIEQTKKNLKSLEAQRAEVGEKLTSVEKLTALQNAREAEAVNATERHEALKKAHEQIAALRNRISVSESSLAPKQEKVAEVESRVTEARAEAAKAESDYNTGCDETRAARLRRDLAVATVQLLEKKGGVEQLLARAEKIRIRQEKVERLREELVKLPNIDARKLAKLQALEADVGKAEAALNAMAAGVEVIAADAPVQIGNKSLVAGESQIVTETTEISFGNAFRLRIRPGGGDSLAEARKNTADVGKKLQQSLDELGLESVVKAAEIFSRRSQLQGSIDQEDTALQGMDAENVPSLLATAQQEEIAAQAEADRRLERVPGATPPADLALARESLISDEDVLRTAESAEVNFKVLRDAAQKGLKAVDEELTRTRQSIDKEASDLKECHAQLRLLLENHNDDEARSQALNEAFSAKTNSETALKETRAALAELQPKVLGADRDRYQRAWDEAVRQQQEAQTKQTEARVELRSDGSSDPAGDLAHAEAKLESVRRHLDGVRRKAEAIQLLDTLFTQEQQAMADHFTQPLVEKISGYLQCLFGPEARAVVTLGEGTFTGMQLVRSGNGDGAMPFDSLSGGAREQVAAAVRLAMAEVLAGDHGDCLPVVFDDAFAYSDPNRVQTLQRMLDLAANRGLQVIVLTCNPSGYVGLGARQVSFSVPMLTVGYSAGHFLTESDTDGTTNLSTEGLPETEHPAPSVSDEQRQQLLEALREVGGKSGNQSLRETLGWDEEKYNAVKDCLLVTAEITAGRGRGGSVSLSGDVADKFIQI